MIITTQNKNKFVPITKNNDITTICFGFKPVLLEDGKETDFGTWAIHSFKKKVNFAQIKNFILNSINENTDAQILNGFVWNNMPIWLSVENQINYKSTYDLAIQTNGGNLPVTFKFGNVEPIYYEFKTIEELTDFYTGLNAHINNCLKDGWLKKDSINWDDYKL